MMGGHEIFDHYKRGITFTRKEFPHRDYYDEDEEEEYDEEEADAEADYEEELMYRSYEILSDFYKKHFVDLRVLDTSCDPVSGPGGRQENKKVSHD